MRNERERTGREILRRDRYPLLALQFRLLRPAAHARAVAQELLHLAFVAIGLDLAAPDGRHAQVLGERLHGLPRGVAQGHARRLELAVVDAAAEAQLVEHLG